MSTNRVCNVIDLDALEAAATPRSAVQTTKKGKAPPVIIDELKPLTQTYENVYRAFKDCEARKDEVSATIQGRAEGKRIELCRQFGQYFSSLDVNGDVLFVCAPPHFTTMLKDHARIGEVKALCGPDFKTFFARVFIPDPSPENIAKMAAAGVQYAVHYKPTRALHEARSLDPRVAELCEQMPEIKPMLSVRACK